MIKVQSHSAPYKVANPARRGEVNTMVNVVFVEEGRSGANAQLTSSSDYLSGLLGEQTGLSNLRTHTQPVLANTIGKFPIGAEFPGHINRALYSQPQIQNQVGRAPRMIDGRPTFFTTTLAQRPEEDTDNRLSKEIAAALEPSTFKNNQIRTAEVLQLTQEELDEFAEPDAKPAKQGRRANA